MIANNVLPRRLTSGFPPFSLRDRNAGRQLNSTDPESRRPQPSHGERHPKRHSRRGHDDAVQAQGALLSSFYSFFLFFSFVSVRAHFLFLIVPHSISARCFTSPSRSEARSISFILSVPTAVWWYPPLRSSIPFLSPTVPLYLPPMLVFLAASTLLSTSSMPVLPPSPPFLLRIFSPTPASLIPFAPTSSAIVPPVSIPLSHCVLLFLSAFHARL